MKTWYLAAATSLMFASPATAAVTVYNNLASFTGALSSSQTVDFNSLGNGFYGGPGFGGVGQVTAGGVTVTTTTSFLFSQANNAYGTGTNLSAQQFSPTSVNVLLGSPITAFGFNYSTRTPVTIAVGGHLLSANSSPFPNLGFIGFTADSPFSNLSISVPGDGIDLDNFTFGVATPIAAVPEPSTWGIMIVGFGMVGMAARRRKAVRVTYA